MPSMADTIARLREMAEARGVAGGPGTPPASPLRPLTDFGSNPGALRGWLFVPPDLAPGAALVVVLHGCTQTAAGYDHGAGWSTLAARHGFALLFPEQDRANNPNLCFNWFQPEDVRRGGGEVASIAQMVEAVLARHPIDPARVFATGLSAGGAMTAALLATYPERFAGGAIIAGLPFGVARSVPEAFDRMRGAGGPEGAALSALVRAASPHAGPWPRLSIWQGDADRTVAPVNADRLVDQWLPLFGTTRREPPERVDGQRRTVWRDRTGRAVVERFDVAGLGHGTPIAGLGADACGVAGPFMLEAGIASSAHIACFWGIAPAPRAATATVPRTGAVSSAADTTAASARAASSPAAAASRASAPPRSLDPGTRIRDALRAAGLLR